MSEPKRLESLCSSHLKSKLSVPESSIAPKQAQLAEYNQMSTHTILKGANGEWNFRPGAVACNVSDKAAPLEPRYCTQATHMERQEADYLGTSWHTWNLASLQSHMCNPSVFKIYKFLVKRLRVKVPYKDMTLKHLGHSGLTWNIFLRVLAGKFRLWPFGPESFSNE